MENQREIRLDPSWKSRLEGEIEAPPGPSLAEVEEEFSLAEAELEKLRSSVEALKEASKFINKAADRFGRKMAERIGPRLSELAAEILGGRYEEVRVAGDLSLKVRPKRDAIWREVGSLSMGAREQLYFLLRAAAVEAMSRTKEPLPMILDEPFAHYDKERRQKAWKFLFDLSKEIQIVFFTCHRQHFLEAVKSASVSKIQKAGELELAFI